MTDPFEDLFLEQRTEDCCSRSGTGGAKHSTTTRERYQVVGATLVAIDAGKPALEVTVAWKAGTARLERENHFVHEPTPEAIGPLEALLPAALDPLVDLVHKPQSSPSRANTRAFSLPARIAVMPSPDNATTRPNLTGSRNVSDHLAGQLVSKAQLPRLHAVKRMFG